MKQKQFPKQVIVNAAVAGASCLPMGGQVTAPRNWPVSHLVK